jgi:23S rRNA (uridine2552-2'-O)-methyltransferase
MDLGAAPGSWTEYMISLLGSHGALWAIDEQPLSPACLEKVKRAGLKFVFLEQSVFMDLPENLPAMDVIVSDMAPFTQGNRGVDCARSLDLINQAFDIAKKHLKNGGHFLVKLFHSDDTIAASKSFGKHFEFSKLYRPPAVAKDSKEIYFLGMQYARPDITLED